MKLHFIFVAVLSAFFTHPAAAQSGREHCVMFYNVENLFHPSDDSTTAGDDDFTPEGVRRWNFYRYNRKVAAICKVILAVNGWEPPDAVCLSEIENVRVLNDIIFHPLMLGQHYRVLHRDSPDHRGIDVGMLYRADRMECLDTSWIVIRNSEGAVVPTREILVAAFRLKTAGDTVVICANHWTSKYGGALETEENRLLQARALGTYVDRLLQPLSNETHTSVRDRQRPLSNETPTSIRDRQRPLTNETPTSIRDRQRPLTNETPTSIRDRQRMQEKDTSRLVQLQVPEKDTSGRPETQAPGKHVHGGLHRISVIAGGDLNDLAGSVPLQLLTDTFQLQAVLPGMYHGPAAGPGVPTTTGPGTTTTTSHGSPTTNGPGAPTTTGHGTPATTSHGTPTSTGSGTPTTAGTRPRRPFLSGNSSSPGTLSTPVSTYKYQGNWGSIDHVFVGGSLRAEDCSCFVFRHPLLLEEDTRYTGKKPYRTYNGFSYHGGISDHLPLLLHFVVD